MAAALYAAPMGRWKFVGRTDELNRLVRAATSPDSRGLFLSGTAGVGKSRLLAQSLEQLSALGCAVWSASANIATAGIPFGGLAQVLPADQPAGLTPAGILRWAVEALHQQAAGRRIVIGIDDAHLLDASSAALVYLIARSDNATVLGTLRSGEPVPLPIRALWSDDLVDHAELGPMTPAETAELLTAMLDGPIDPSSADRLHRLSAGNALLLRELVIAAHASNELNQAYGVWRWTGRSHLSPSLDDLVDARIGQLDPSVRAVVELVAMGEPIGLALLNRATDPAAVEMAEERGLIRVVTHDRRSDVRLAHPLYGEVVRRRCPVTRVRRLSAQLADLVEEVGTRRRDDLLRVAAAAGVEVDVAHAAAHARPYWTPAPLVVVGADLADARALADPAVRAEDFDRPGHVLPLRVRDGGVLEHAVPAEAGVDLARLAGVSAITVSRALAGNPLVNPETAARIKALARELGVREAVRFLGARRDVARVLAASDVLVVPSQSEGLGRAPIEANLVGLPVVAFATGGLREVIEHPDDGVLVPEGDLDAFARAVSGLLARPTLHDERLRQARAQRAADRFGIDAHVRRLRECYERAAGASIACGGMRSVIHRSCG